MKMLLIKPFVCCFHTHIHACSVTCLCVWVRHKHIWEILTYAECCWLLNVFLFCCFLLLVPHTTHFMLMRYITHTHIHTYTYTGTDVQAHEIHIWEIEHFSFFFWCSASACCGCVGENFAIFSFVSIFILFCCCCFFWEMKKRGKFCVFFLWVDEFCWNFLGAFLWFKTDFGEFYGDGKFMNHENYVFGIFEVRKNLNWMSKSLLFHFLSDWNQQKLLKSFYKFLKFPKWHNIKISSKKHTKKNIK